MHVIRYDDESCCCGTPVKSFSVPRGWLTLSVANQQLMCCSTSVNQVAVYSLSGQFLHINGSLGAGQLRCPLACHGGKVGVLIADSKNNRLQTMSGEGKFKSLQLQPPVSEPRGAVLLKAKNIYVTSRTMQTIYKYDVDRRIHLTVQSAQASPRAAQASPRAAQASPRAPLGTSTAAVGGNRPRLPVTAKRNDTRQVVPQVPHGTATGAVDGKLAPLLNAAKKVWNLTLSQSLPASCKTHSKHKMNKI